MKRERNALSNRDKLLLQRRFRIKEPQKHPGLTERLEKGTVPVRILHDYDETPPGGLKAGHKPHIRCCFGHLHWHGYIAEFVDGRVGLLGERCARRDFGTDVIDAIERDFNAERDRQFEIQRLFVVRQTLPAALSELRDLDVRGFDIVWQTFTRRYGKASQMLARGVRSSQGRLIAYRTERNKKAEEAEARRANKSLFRDWDNAADAAERRRLTAEVRRYIDSRPHIYMDVPVDMGPCDGWRLLIVSERSTPARLAAEALDLLSTADDASPIERWGRSDFARMRRAIDDAFAKLDEAAGLVACLLQLASPANRERIADWSMQCKLDFEIILPDGYGWPATPALDALRGASATSERARKVA